MQVVYVAGGAGFIGSHLCAKLLENNYKVVCLDNFLTSAKTNITPLMSNPNFQLVEIDILNPLPTNLEKPNFIFHLASPASPNVKSPRSYMAYPLETLLVNSEGTHKLLELAKTTQARFLFASTSEVYGDPDVSPQPETYFGNVNPNGLRSVYDEAKRFGEALCMHYFRKGQVDTRIVRIFNTYGPNMQVDDGRVVSNFITQALKGNPLTVYGDGTQTRSFCYATDMVDGLMKFMFSEDVAGEVINIGNPEEYTVLQFAQKIIQLTSSKSVVMYEPLPEDDPKLRKPDITKAKHLLSWEPQINVIDGLTKTIEYFKSL